MLYRIGMLYLFLQICKGGALLIKTSYTTFEYFKFFQDGKEIGFDHFFQEFYPALCIYAGTICKDLEAGKDQASSAFINVWKKRSEMSSPEHLKRYLYRTTRNICITWLRSKQRQVEEEQAASLILRSTEETHLHTMIKAEMINHLHKQIRQLPQACRKVFIKMYVEGKTVKETAYELNLHISTVKTQKARGLLYLRKSFMLD